ncbi:MAG: hypothetical protein JWM57_2870, partial [Phycisphaerales bacterium]|nr:hypothetical protein [Phycisphaerales bacterium]
DVPSKRTVKFKVGRMMKQKMIDLAAAHEKSAAVATPPATPTAS